MLSQRRMYHPTIKQDLGCIGDSVEHLESLLKLMVVVERKGRNPGLDFLLRYEHSYMHDERRGPHLLQRHGPLFQ